MIKLTFINCNMHKINVLKYISYLKFEDIYNIKVRDLGFISWSS